MAGHQPDRYTQVVEFRTKLISTLKAIQSVLDVPGVMVIGSEVPNLLQPEADYEELGEDFLGLSAELRYAVRSNLTILSLMQEGMKGMPDPRPQRARVAGLLAQLEGLEGGEE
ncbi:MAG: hypothetical protein DRJ65_15850 [Acidobacteria bacterium]|nr:MAG: hypothetical protein DRJ65_15850 [Acidobacteriota bacterium]